MVIIIVEYKGRKKLLYVWKERTTPGKSKGVICLLEWWNHFQINNIETQAEGILEKST